MFKQFNRWYDSLQRQFRVVFFIIVIGVPSIVLLTSGQQRLVLLGLVYFCFFALLRLPVWYAKAILQRRLWELRRNEFQEPETVELIDFKAEDRGEKDKEPRPVD
ncbi:hypothetical protein HQ571_05460 [Candidatus Kuenenbacteria bacterium]|nr:hypothetical protein [Candidatus Kuenenbacteria bacterium]